MSTLLPMGDLQKRLKSVFGRAGAGTDSEETFRQLAGDMSIEEMNKLSPNTRAAVMTEKVQKSFSPITNVLGNSPQGLAKRLAARGVQGAAEAVGGKDAVEEAADEYEEYVREISERTGREWPNDRSSQPDTVTKTGEAQAKKLEDLRTKAREYNQMSQAEKEAAKKATEAARKAAEPTVVDKAGEVVRKTSPLLRAIKIRQSTNRRFRSRQEEAEARGEPFEANSLGEVGPSFGGVLAEQVIPGSRYSKNAFERRMRRR